MVNLLQCPMGPSFSFSKIYSKNTHVERRSFFVSSLAKSSWKCQNIFDVKEVLQYIATALLQYHDRLKDFKKNKKKYVFLVVQPHLCTCDSVLGPKAIQRIQVMSTHREHWEAELQQDTFRPQLVVFSNRPHACMFAVGWWLTFRSPSLIKSNQTNLIGIFSNGDLKLVAFFSQKKKPRNLIS